MALVLLFLYIPIFVLIVFSFNVTKSRSVFSGFTFDWYIKLFHNGLIMKSLFKYSNSCDSCVNRRDNSRYCGGNRYKQYEKNCRERLLCRVRTFLLLTPKSLRVFRLCFLFVFFAARMNFEFGFVTLIIAHITFDVPYVILNIMPKFRQMNPHLYEAAQDLGCSPVSAFFKVVLPEILPGVISGFLMSFTFSLDDFVISYFTSGATSQTLPITIYSMTRRKVSPEINALSTIIFVIVVIVLVVKNVIERRNAVKARC